MTGLKFSTDQQNKKIYGKARRGINTQEKLRHSRVVYLAAIWPELYSLLFPSCSVHSLSFTTHEMFGGLGNLLPNPHNRYTVSESSVRLL